MKSIGIGCFLGHFTQGFFQSLRIDIMNFLSNEKTIFTSFFLDYFKSSI